MNKNNSQKNNKPQQTPKKQGSAKPNPVKKDIKPVSPKAKHPVQKPTTQKPIPKSEASTKPVSKTGVYVDLSKPNHSINLAPTKSFTSASPSLVVNYDLTNNKPFNNNITGDINTENNVTVATLCDTPEYGLFVEDKSNKFTSFINKILKFFHLKK